MSRREPGKRKGLPRGRGNLAPQFDSPPPAPPPPPPPRAERLTLASGARHRARPPFHRKCRLLPAGPPLTSPRAASLAAAPPGPTLPPAARSRASQPAAARRGQPAACFPHLQRRRAGCCGACPASLTRARSPGPSPCPQTPRGVKKGYCTRESRLLLPNPLQYAFLSQGPPSPRSLCLMQQSPGHREILQGLFLRRSESSESGALALPCVLGPP